MPLSSEDIPTADGPNASLPFGEATQFRQANREIQSAGSSPRNPMPGMPQGAGQQQPMGPPQGGAPQPPPGPVQPAPPQSRGPGGQQLDAGGVFSKWDGDGLGDMARLDMWAHHPSRPRVIQMLNDRARGGRDTTGR